VLFTLAPAVGARGVPVNVGLFIFAFVDKSIVPNDKTPEPLVCRT